MKIIDLLRGVQVGNIQSAGIMSVIPLTMPKKYQKAYFTDISKLRFRTDGDYGTMKFQNLDNSLGIVPLGYAYLDKKQGQDHALPHTGMVSPRGMRVFETAACVQSSRGGNLTSTENIDYRLLPYSLRKACLEVSYKEEYDKLWPYILQLNSLYGIDTSNKAHIEDFYDKFDKELATFVAQFECVPNQVGAIVLIGKHVVGIELTPSEGFWSNVWEKLIRDVYGSLAMLRSERSNETFRKPFVSTARTLQELESDVKQSLTSYDDFVKDVAQEFVEMSLDSVEVDRLTWQEKVFTVNTVKDAGLVGQVLLEGYEPVYISLCVDNIYVHDKSRSRRMYASRPAFGF